MRFSSMRRLRSIAALGLLVTLVAGSLLAPTLHRLQHAAQQTAQRADAPCHSRAVHDSPVPLWTVPHTELVAPDCVLCATRQLFLSTAVAPVVAPTVDLVVQATERTHLTAAVVAAVPFIRGPPRRA